MRERQGKGGGEGAKGSCMIGRNAVLIALFLQGVLVGRWRSFPSCWSFKRDPEAQTYVCNYGISLSFSPPTEQQPGWDGRRDARRVGAISVLEEAYSSAKNRTSIEGWLAIFPKSYFRRLGSSTWNLPWLLRQAFA